MRRVMLSVIIKFFIFLLMYYNGSAMVSTGIKSSELSIKHLAKTFYFVLSLSTENTQISRSGLYK